MRIFTSLFLLSISASTTAGVYKWVQPDGSVIYSDRPPVENASPADLPPVQEIKIVPPAASSAEPATDEGMNQSQARTYTKLEITEPADDSTIRENSGQIHISLALEPSLQEGDSIAILLDGKEIGQGKGTSLTINNVDRGKHTLQAAVKSASGSSLIRSPSTTFNLLRASTQQPKPK